MSRSFRVSQPDRARHLIGRTHNRVRSLLSRRKVQKVSAILGSRGMTDTSVAESAFSSLQDAYDPRPEYGYDAVSTWRRATTRSISIASIPGLETPGKQILDVGAGDGMLGVALNAFGHSASLVDHEDWRHERARSVAFHVADCCEALPFGDSSFDLACSYNSFEHFADPAVTFSEMVRVVRPGGWIYLEFGPLFGSPWGLHAYRSLRMPYPQFLFSEQYVLRKLGEIGIWDLGKNRAELQYLNRWRPADFERLWEHPNCVVATRNLVVDDSELDVVIAFPEAFRGRNLTLEDITVANISVTLRKNG
jgi:ubiquinone/menaquinone biosynthesis C-methylase UbiE